MLKKLFLAQLIILLAVSAIFAGTLDKKVILIGTESTYPPYEFRDGDNVLQGLDIELTDAIIDGLGKSPEWVDMPFDNLIPALLAGKIDLIAAGMSATPERAKQVSFSDPYEISLSSFVTAADRDDLKRPEDLKGATVAVQQGTVQDTYAASLPDVTVKPFRNFGDCVREVFLGRADVAIMDRPVAREFLRNAKYKDGLRIAFDREISGAGKALAVRQEDGAFLDEVNGVLSKMKESGRLAEVRNRWMTWDQ